MLKDEDLIEKQLQADFEKFYHGKYSGTLSIPDNLHDLFKRAVLSLPPNFHVNNQTNFHKIKAVYKTHISELTMVDINCMLFIILNAPLDKLYNVYDESFENVIDAQIKLDKFVQSFNSTVKDFEEKLRIKKVSLLSIKNSHKEGKLIPLA